MTLLITACSKNKRAKRAPSAAELGQGTADEIAEEWIDRLLAEEDRFAAGTLYSGRGHAYASVAAHLHRASHLIMSAGLGLIRSADSIPPYRLTVKNGQEDSILPHLAPSSGASEWWGAVKRYSPWSRVLTEEWDGSAIILIALPLDYLQMLAPDLERLPRPAMASVRVISGANLSALPTSLRAHHLSYDARLNGPDSTERGTDSDFLGRAVAHFLHLLEGDRGGCLNAHSELVERALQTMRPAQRRHGRPLSDDAVATIIRSELALAKRGSSELLRTLRRDLGVACEQSRFRRLYTDVISELPVT